ncbi:MAG: helix-turn-helix domain-containing protein [Armatimonadetes bacterium]|nr:helix-turn-helix domain-containing protein [Armatimonadota bacterium]
MEHEEVAKAFKALGDQTRLKMFEYICACGCCSEGELARTPTVGEVAEQVLGQTQTSSTASFHLKELRQAGLIHMEKRGKYICCCVRPEALLLVQNFLSRPGLTELQIAPKPTESPTSQGDNT